MANTLTGLIQIFYEALNPIQRELVGLVSAVSRDSRVSRAALNQTVRVPVVPAASTADLTPGQLPPDTGDATIGFRDLTMSKSKISPVRWTGEEELALRNGDIHRPILVDRWTQAIRALVNEMESDLASLYAEASRAYGTAGTTPFGTADDLTDIAETRRILDDNGVPQTDLQLVLNSAAMAKMRGIQSSLWKVNEAGTEEFLREGFISQGLQGFAIRNSAQMPSHTKGTSSGHLVNAVGGLAVGATTIPVDLGTGTILAGDVVTFAEHSDKYVVTTALSGGEFVIAEPGLQAAVADNEAVTVGANYKANLALHRSAMLLATRLPAMPEGGDSADDTFTLTDPLSGISFEIAVYREFARVHYQVRLAWGFEVVKPEFIATLLG